MRNVSGSHSATYHLSQLRGKGSACNSGDTGSIPGLGRSPGGGNGNPPQYSCWGNPMDRGTTVHGVARVGHDLASKPSPPPPSVTEMWGVTVWFESSKVLFVKEHGSDLTFWPTACDCNGRSQECYFDPELYRSTGHGGHCTSCQDNTDGAKCERCRENFFRRGNGEACSPCHCSPVGKWQPGSASAWWVGRQKKHFLYPQEIKLCFLRILTG